ncbi:DUF7019 family protein [Streptomyces sp. NPDC001407]|uniref:DUF7019 family protein n=1 Tax=Streptomyces sp. NPDC001407 TaxID=3364573 RepID=UPI0036BDC9B2
MIGRYLYWSDRAVRRIAEDNGIDLARRGRWTVGLNWHVFQASRAGGERLTRNRLGEAQQVEKALHAAVVEDFVAPPPAAFVKGTGKVSFSRFIHRYAKGPAALLHIRTHSATGQRVDICLFGGMDNVAGFGPWDDFEDGWTPSSAPAIEELLRTRGRENTYLQDDEQYRSSEALKIALQQGHTGPDTDYERPETRGFTMGHNGDCTFFAEVYTDVALDPNRWRFQDDDPLTGADRIIVGRPLWVRTVYPEATVRYPDLRNGPGWTRWWRLRRWMPRRSPRPRVPLPSPGRSSEDIPPTRSRAQGRHAHDR